MEQTDDKTQEATPHRRQQAREQGQVAKSQDLGNALLLVGALVALSWFGGAMVDFFGSLATEHLGGRAWLAADDYFAIEQWNRIVWGVGMVLLPILGLILVWDVVVNVAQVGLLFLPEKLTPDITRLDPIQGFARIFSLRGTVRLGFGFFKVGVVAVVAYICIRNERDAILSLAELAVPQIAKYTVDVLFWITLKIAVALAILALLDYGFQWWKQEQDLRMTTQEVREEMKNLQGDPQIIARRRQVQRQLVLSRLKTAVPKADVVITNPTELAIAIEYKPDTMAAPVVVAKGAGVLAQRIRRLALEHGIPIVEKKPLAQTLYKEVDLNRPIPHQLYGAVAEVLAYVYQLKGKKMPTGRASS